MSVPDFTSENVEKALHQLYYDPSLTSKDIAQRWLTKAQRAKQAWQFAWELLEVNKATEVQYFGASSLVSKISGSWCDIPEKDVIVLRDRLFDQLLCFCNLPDKQIVLTRLCIAFSAFFANCVIRNLWPTAITDIIEKLKGKQSSNISEENLCNALLEILTILPEEYQTNKMEKYKRSLVMHQLRSSQSEVISLLQTVFHNPSTKCARVRVIKCISSWIIFGIPLVDCEDLLVEILDCVKQPDLFDVSVDCLLNTFCSPCAHDYPNTVKKLMPLVILLRPMLHKAVEDHDSETILGLTKIICGLAENQTNIIIASLSDPKNGLGLIYMVMDCGSIPLQYPTEEWSSPISFTFWCSLQDEIQALSVAESVTIREQMHPFFYELVNLLLQKASYPKDNSHNDWSADEKEQHRIYRVDISDTLMYLLDMLGVNILLFIFDKLQACLQEFSSNPDKPWHGIETCLFGIHSFVETLTEYDTEIPCLKALAEILPTIHVNSLQLADTLLYTIGTLTEWLSYHADTLWVLFSIVLSCLSNSDLSLTTVLTLRRLTRECSEHLVPHASNIMDQISNILVRGILRNNEETWLMQSAGHILSSLPQEDCLKHLQNLLVLQMHQLEALSKDSPSVPNKNSIIHILDLLTHLFCTLDRRKENDHGKIIKNDEEQPAVLILQKLEPIVKNILNCWITDSAVVEAVCTLYDKSIRSLVSDFSPLVLQLSDMLCVIYQTYPHTCVLNLSQQIVLVFGGEAEHQDTVSTLLHTLVKTTTPIYDSGHIKDHPDIAHCFMRFLAHTCRKQFNLFKLEVEKHGHSSLFDLFKYGIMTLHLPDSESANSASSFLIDLLSHYFEHTEVTIVVDKAGKDLLSVVLKAIGGSSPRSSMDNFADILLSMCRCNFSLFNTWLNELMNEPDIPCQTMDSSQKNAFVKQLIRDGKNKRKYRDIVKEFTLICRGLHGTEYAS